MPKTFFLLLVIVTGLTACTSPLLAPFFPTATLTPTLTPTPTSTFTPSPTATETPIPTDTPTPTPAMPQSRDQFEEMVKSGAISCQGYQHGSVNLMMKFVDEAIAGGVIPHDGARLGSGIPSPDNPEKCFYILTFDEDSNMIIVYKDGNTGEFVKIKIPK